MKKTLLLVISIVVLVGSGLVWWFFVRTPPLVGFASGNGRLEAQEIEIATKFAGRIADVLAREGDLVDAGQLVARMDTESLEAQIREAEAEIQKAKKDRNSAEAEIRKRRSEELLADRDLGRARTLYANTNLSLQDLDKAEMTFESTKAATAQAEAQLAAVEATILAAVAQKEKLEADLKESVLLAPQRGTIEYRLAEPGEVLPAGGKVLTLIDLSDVYMTLFLPETEVGRVALGAEARIVLDAAPTSPIPATVSFVASKAQFTPKEVETRSEREKLMFRIKVQIDPTLVKAHEKLVKTGVPGMAYVRLDPNATWPESLRPRQAS